jgi:hypothetical protein
VSVGNLMDSVSHNTGSGSNLNWQSYSSVFQATSSTSTLSFVNTAGGANGGLFIDNISVAAVPEPATWAMMLLGFGLIGAGMRRRKTNLRVSFS